MKTHQTGGADVALIASFFLGFIFAMAILVGAALAQVGKGAAAPMKGCTTYPVPDDPTLFMLRCPEGGVPPAPSSCGNECGRRSAVQT